jgi:hypothetical protein
VVTDPILRHDALDLDPIAGKEPQRALEESDRRGGLLVGEHLDVASRVASSIAMCTNSQPCS